MRLQAQGKPMITQQVFFFIWIAWIAHPLDLTLFRAEGLGGEGGGGMEIYNFTTFGAF